MNNNKNPKISDNPGTKKIADLMPLVKFSGAVSGLALRFGLGGEKLKQFNKQISSLIEQSSILELPDLFNAAFLESGWIATNSMPIDLMRHALDCHDSGYLDEANELIMQWFSEETINRCGINPSKRFSKSLKRWDQLREALALTIEERYFAAVPLILIASDGFASDVLGTSPFEKDADLTLFDSLVGHPTALPTLIGKFKIGVRKSSDDELSWPLRHGILHGRSLGYANRQACCKAWMLLIALVDWADDKRSEEERRQSHEDEKNSTWGDLAKSHQKIQADKAAIEAFEPLSWAAPYDEHSDPNTPPFAFWEFLNAWKNRNFGTMAKRAVNLTQQPVNHLAGQMRKDAELVELLDFEIRSVRQVTVARSEAIVFMRGKTLIKDVEGEFLIPGFYHTHNGDLAMPTDDGYWAIQQGCLFDLMHLRTLEFKNQNTRSEG